MSTTSPQQFKIGDVAALVGVTARTIRYYEELGLLGADRERPKGGHRVYTDADVARLRELVRLRDLLGLTLEELTHLAEAEQARGVLRNRWESTSNDEERSRILADAIPLVERQLELVRNRRERLNEFEHELNDKLASMRRRAAQLDGS